MVDVRDVAQAHILCYENAGAEGRFLCIGDCPSWSEVCDVLREIVPDAAAQIPTELDPNLPPASLGAPPPHRTLSDCSKLEALGLKFRDAKEMVAGTVAGLREFGHLK